MGTTFRPRREAPVALGNGSSMLIISRHAVYRGAILEQLAVESSKVDGATFLQIEHQPRHSRRA